MKGTPSTRSRLLPRPSAVTCQPAATSSRMIPVPRNPAPPITSAEPAARDMERDCRMCRMVTLDKPHTAPLALSREDVEFYDEHGFLRLKGVYSKDEVAELSE